MANTTTKEEIMLRMHDIHKSFGDLEVLKGIDIEVRRGEEAQALEQWGVLFAPFLRFEF